MKTMVTALYILLVSGAIHAAESGQVQLPLATYTELVSRAQPQPGAAPAGYAFGECRVSVELSSGDQGASAEVNVQLAVKINEAKWTRVALLPPGTAVMTATAAGSGLALIQDESGTDWGTNQAGTHQLTLRYGAEVADSGAGASLTLALPRAACRLSATIPGAGLDVSVMPSMGTRVASSGQVTSVTASVPAMGMVTLSWGGATKRDHALSRAEYKGELKGEAMAFTAEFSVEVFAGRALTLPLMPRAVALAEVTVDGKRAPVLVEEENFATIVKGQGTHAVVVSFEVPVRRDEGAPHVDFAVPEVPVSRFELRLPGKKTVSVTPAASVSNVASGGQTVATVHVPMTASVSFSWVEAIPVEVEAELSANASLVSLVHAEEGVLQVRAIATWEITHGETNQLVLEVPESIQVNHVSATAGGVADWRLSPAAAGKSGTLTVFLDRKVKGTFAFEVQYERLLGSAAARGQHLSVPLLRASRVHRQRSMVALLTGADLALKPAVVKGLVEVGENQLPPELRQGLGLTVAHTYKGGDEVAELNVEVASPEKKPASFDADVDTLVSLGDVSLKGLALIELNLKSGSLSKLELALPEHVSVLGLSAPSLRTWAVNAAEGKQLVTVEFTQEMEGQFRLELNYERILGEAEARVEVPAATVVGAEVEHGRIGVEALTAVEVGAAEAVGLSALEASELPQQLVLRTTNPILLAYKYVRGAEPSRLALKVSRHKQIEVQVATIDDASYRTLVTRDGLSVTAARYFVRNGRKQFLRVELPPDSELWSVFVDGRAEKPAMAEGGERDQAPKHPAVLIKMVNSVDGFPVDLVYATRMAPVGFIGTLSGRLPRPDMVVTHTRWDVFLPDGLSYRSPSSNMDILTAYEPADPAAMRASLGDVAKAGAAQPSGPLHINVPVRGVHFAFDKLYADQAKDDASFAIGYASLGGQRVTVGASLVGTLLLWAGAIALALKQRRRQAVAAVVVGVALLIATVGFLGAGRAPAEWLSTAIAVALVITYARQRWGHVWRRRFATPIDTPPA